MHSWCTHRRDRSRRGRCRSRSRRLESREGTSIADPSSRAGAVARRPSPRRLLRSSMRALPYAGGAHARRTSLRERPASASAPVLAPEHRLGWTQGPPTPAAPLALQLRRAVAPTGEAPAAGSTPTLPRPLRRVATERSDPQPTRQWPRRIPRVEQEQQRDLRGSVSRASRSSCPWRRSRTDGRAHIGANGRPML